MELEDWARGSAWVYPIANVLHVLGAIMLVGGIGIVDLRVAGLWKTLPVVALSRALTPVAIAGLLMQGSSGFVMFAADSTALAGSGVFQAKLVLIVLALANAAWFRRHWRRAAGGSAYEPSAVSRASAFASLALWTAIVVEGRLIAYF